MSSSALGSSISSNSPNLRTFLDVAPESNFPIQNLPYGVFSPEGRDARIGVAIGDYVLDLALLADRGLLGDEARRIGYFSARSLNSFMGQGRTVWSAVRSRISELLRHDCPTLRDNAALRAEVLYIAKNVMLHLPIEVAGYTDFYSSIDHARNVGALLRGADNALFPNWRHVPIAYDGRAGSVVVSGTPVRRPWGQMRPSEDAGPIFGPSKALDFELELAFVVGVASELGRPISCREVDDHVFGAVLLNDWSARDIQKWEYQPLGPFLGKNFCTSISPWVVPLEALEPFKVAATDQEPAALPYLQSARQVFNIELEVAVRSAQMSPLEESVVTRSNARYLYWDHYQQLAHHTVGGCSMSVGDLYATGTISGPQPESRGCLLELTEGGKKPLVLANGEERRYLLDGDSVTLRGWAEYSAGESRYRVGFGEATGAILPPFDLAKK
jgi:fumarylacetoacetase